MKQRAKNIIRILREGRRDEDPPSFSEIPTDAGPLWVQAGSLWASTPSDEFGPFTAVEVKYPGDKASRRFVPVGEVIAYIEEHAD